MASCAGWSVPEQGGPVLRGTAGLHVGLSELYLERGDLHAATQHLLKSQDLGEHTGLPQHRYRWRVAMNSLVGIERAPDSLALVAGTGAFLAMFGNPFFGRMSDRTASRLGMRRPWMVIGLVGGSLGIVIVAWAPNIPVVLAGWCIAQLFFNALLAAMVAVLPDQVPAVQRGLVSGVLGVCLPVASVCGTFLVKLFTGNMLAMFLAPCAIGGFFILLFAVTLKDRRLASAEKPAWSLREFASTFYVNPRPDNSAVSRNGDRHGQHRPNPSNETAGERNPDELDKEDLTRRGHLLPDHLHLDPHTRALRPREEPPGLDSQRSRRGRRSRCRRSASRRCTAGSSTRSWAG
jgi:hypothetical protein